MYICYCDIETFSDVPIAYGTHRYAEGAELLLWGYAINDQPAKVWDATSGAPMPRELDAIIAHAMNRRAMFVWHNGMMFDTVVLEKLGYLKGVPLRAHWDAMVQAYQHGLPGALSDLCKVLGLTEEQSKKKDGARLVQKFCKPAPKGRKVERYTAANSPEDWARFVDYCRMDVESMRTIYKKMPSFNCSRQERGIQEVDAKINRRGFRIDLDLARAALKLDLDHKAALRQKTIEKTDGAVTAATQRDRLRSYIADTYGINFDDLRKSTMEREIESETLPEPVKELLRLRLATAKTSATKYTKAANAASSDGRLRGCIQFRGASRTGRFSGKIFQPQNMARPAFKEAGVELGIASLKDGSAEWLYEGEEAKLLSSCLRGLVIADPGKLFVVNDWSNVEGRGLAWLAHEQWKLQAFRDFDAGHGHDLYKMTYGKTFGIDPEDVTKSQRQMGKVLELALGYGGGVGALVTFSLSFGMDLDKLADEIYKAVPVEFVKAAEDSYQWFVDNKATHGLSKRTFVALDAVKRAWRAANPNIVRFWGNVGTAVREVLTTGGWMPTNHLEVRKRGRWLTVELPSGRLLTYADARLEEGGSDSFTYLGTNQMTRKWERLESYSSKVVENVTQAMCCDLLTQSLVALEREDILPVMHVHDEIICEVPAAKAEESFNRMVEIMTNPGPTYQGLPLAVDGFIGDRYKKKD